jgi:hypothetical protein
MRKKYRIVKSSLGYSAELNTRHMVNGESIRDDWPDSWIAIGGHHETIEGAKQDIEYWKASTQFEIVYEE